MNAQTISGSLSSRIEQFTSTSYSLLNSLRVLTDNAKYVTSLSTKDYILFRAQMSGNVIILTLRLCAVALLHTILNVSMTVLRTDYEPDPNRRRYAYVYEREGFLPTNKYHGLQQHDAIEKWLLVRFPKLDYISLELYLTKPPRINSW